MITQLWRNSGLVVLAMVIALSAILFHRPLMLVVALFLLVITGLAEWMAGRTLTDIALDHHVSQRILEIGQTVTAEIVFENHMPWPIAHVSWENSLPEAVDVRGPGKVVANAPAHRQVISGQVHVGARQRVRVQYHLTGRARGRWMLGPAAVWFSDTFGFTHLYRDMPERFYITVWPKRFVLGRKFITHQLMEGKIRGKIWDLPDPYHIVGIRPYIVGDPIRRLHPYVSARAGRLMVKELQTVQDRRIELVVHPVTNAEHWMGIDVDRLEELISLAASVVEAGITAGVEVGLTMSGSLPGSPYGYCHQPATGQPVLAEYLTALSWLQPSGAARQLLADRMAEISRRVTTASVVILVCALWEPAVEPLFRSWRARGISLVVITNGDLDARADQFAADIFHWREGKLGHG